ncbi:carboxypeptidase-like regulatory domain-containing protein [Bacteroides sp. 51]|nr:DUF5686 and carboxypeptidase regulatory-like domain-containing protein [Bacteroides sp. 51]NDV83080.1 carboxypeptidase-like regulatory domain-containing protein [Bacteroides sp. 51]
MKLKILFLLLSLFSLPAFSQVFKGKVVTDNGEPIPFATLYIHEISAGLTTDDNGYFHTVLKPGKYTCEVSSLGYIRQILTIEVHNKDIEQNIILNERIYQLREVSITKNSEDPAYGVMRQVIAYAPYYRSFVKSYTAGTYLKGTGKINKIPALLKISKSVREDAKKYVGRLFVLEEQRRVTFTAPNTWNNEVKAYTNSFPDELQVSLETVNINLYQPTIFGKTSPIGPSAFSYYQYKLEGFYTEGEHLINKIRVIPKKGNPELVSGYLYIVENLWCLSAVDLKASYSGFDASVKVTCKEVRSSVFLNTSTTLKADINVMGIKAEASYLSAIHYTDLNIDATIFVPGKDTQDLDKVASDNHSSLTKKQQKLQQQIEQLSKKEELTTRDAYKLSKLVDKAVAEADTTHFKNKYERRSWEYDVKKDSLADKRDSVYWAAVRSVPLKPEEVQSYAYKETLKPLNDSLGRGNINKEKVSDVILQTLLFGKTFKSKNEKSWITLGSYSTYVPEYNFVDGLWIGTKLTAGVKLNAQTKLNFTPEAYYTTARNTWLGSGLLVLDYAPRRLGKLSLSGGALSADFNGESGESRMINAMSSLLFARNDMKFYDKRFLSLDNEIELANSLLLSTGFTWQRREALENSVEKDLFKKHAKPNLPRHPDYSPMQRNELMKASVSLQYTPARYFRMFQGRKYYRPSEYPTFTAKYEKAFSHGGDETLSPSFYRTELSVEQEFEFGLFNRIHWFVNGGAFWDAEDIQFPDYKHFATTRIPVTDHSLNQGFALLDNYAYSTNTRWAQANVSWYTPYLLLKHLPFLKKKRYDEALHLRSLAVYKRPVYWEAGYSIGRSDLLRVGVFVGFERTKFDAVGVSVSLPLLKLLGK